MLHWLFVYNFGWQIWLLILNCFYLLISILSKRVTNCWSVILRICLGKEYGGHPTYYLWAFPQVWPLGPLLFRCVRSCCTCTRVQLIVGIGYWSANVSQRLWKENKDHGWQKEKVFKGWHTNHPSIKIYSHKSTHNRLAFLFNRQIIQLEFSSTWSCISLTRSTTQR